MIIFIFQILAIYTYKSKYWILSEYIWWLFIFIGLFEAIRYAQRNFYGHWEKQIKNRVLWSYDRIKFLLDYYSNIFDVKNDNMNSISEDHLQMQIKWKNYYENHWHEIETIINTYIEKGSLRSKWSKKLKDEIIQKISSKKNTNGLIKQSQTELMKAIKDYHEDWLTFKDYLESKEENPIRRLMFPFTPYLLSLIIAIQFGNVTNKLLDLINS